MASRNENRRRVRNRQSAASEDSLLTADSEVAELEWDRSQNQYTTPPLDTHHSEHHSDPTSDRVNHSDPTSDRSRLVNRHHTPQSVEQCFESFSMDLPSRDSGSGDLNICLSDEDSYNRTYDLRLDNAEQSSHLQSTIIPPIVIQQVEKYSSNKCPLSNNIVSSRRCDHSGGSLASKYGDIKITIPEGAICDEDTITFHVAADLYGPFVLPSQCQTDLISPYYWVGVSESSYHIQKPIQVEFQHFAACNTSHYKLLKCEDDDDSYTMRPIGHDLEFKKQDDISWCVFTTYHFCSYCLCHDYKCPIQISIGAYYLKPDNFRYLTDFTVEVWFSFPISHCLHRNEELYKKKHMILDGSHIFEASCDRSSTSYFTVHFNQTVGWDLQKSVSEILTEKVNFYNHYTSVAALKANEESLSFPPRFIIHVVQEAECTTDLNTNITVTLYEEENQQVEYLFKLSVSPSARNYYKNYYNGPQSYSLSIPSHRCDEHKPQLKELVLYSKLISSEWKIIGLRLEIPKEKINVIDVDNQHSVKDKCYEMFIAWLQITISPCWCHFIKALVDVRLYDVAAEAQKHLESSNMHASVASPNAGKFDSTFQDISTMSNLSEVPIDDSARTQSAVVTMQTADIIDFDSQLVSQMQPPSNHDVQVETNFRNKCPLSNNIVLSRRCDHSGGTLASKYGDIKITIPEGAIRDGDAITFHIAADLYGPFVLPSQCQTDLISPYYWVGVSESSYYIQKPIQVEFQHFAACNTSHYKLLTCEDDDDSYTMRPTGHDLEFKKQDDISWCVFTTYHFCSYCLYHDYKCPIQNSIGAYYLKPDNFRYLTDFTVEVWFSFPISHCLHRNEELYKKKHMILDGSHIFEASCDRSSTSYFTVHFNQTVGWDLQKSLSEILTKKVNFYNYYTSVAALKANEESLSFPPRFIIHVVQEAECTKDLNTNITVTLYEEENKPDEFYLFKLSVSLSARNYYNGPQSYSLSIPSHRCDEHKPELKELVMYSEPISLEWDRIGLRLEIPKEKINVIDVDKQHSVKGKCIKMFEAWLQITISPCWCHFIGALVDVRLYDVAEKAQKHLESSSNSARGNVASPNAGNNNNTCTQMEGDPLNLSNLIGYLQSVPQEKLMFFASFLLPINVIRDIRRSTKTPTDLLKNICDAFLNEADPSWLKVCEALKKARFDDLAETIAACCLPV